MSRQVIKRKRRKSYNINKISTQKPKHINESNRSSKITVDQKTKIKDLRCVYEIPPSASSKERASNNFASAIGIATAYINGSTTIPEDNNY